MAEAAPQLQTGVQQCPPFLQVHDSHSRVSISKLLYVFGIQCSDITLAGLHVFNGGGRQEEFLSGLIALVSVSDGVVAVVVHEESQCAD